MDGEALKPWALPGESRGISAPLDRYRVVADSHGAWPGGWPGALLDPTRLVWREDVFRVAQQWRQGRANSRQLLAAVCVWGHGPNGYGPWRTSQTLATPDSSERLDAALEPLLSARPSQDALADAYRALSDRKTGLDWYRAPFFTKLLYFAGYRRMAGGVQPLILDSVVANLLPDEVGVRKPKGRSSPHWTSAEWLRYCEWALESCEGEPDEVEMRLFNRAGG